MKVLPWALALVALFGVAYSIIFLFQKLLLEYSFALSTDQEIENMTFAPNEWGEEKSGRSFISTLELPDSDAKIYLEHLYFWPPFHLDQMGFETYQENHLFTHFDVWGEVTHIESTVVVNGEEWQSDLEFIYYPSDTPGEEGSTEQLNGDFELTKAIGLYGYDYIIGYPKYSAPFFFTLKDNWFKTATQKISITYVTREKEVKTVEYTFDLIWSFAGMPLQGLFTI